jgi:hypothetical protein
MKRSLLQLCAMSGTPLKVLLDLVDVQLSEVLTPKPPARMSTNNVVWMDAMHFSLTQTPPLLSFLPLNDVSIFVQ